MFTNQRNQNSLFCPGNHFHALYVKFSDRTEKRFIVQQCDSRVSKDQRRFCGRRERLHYRLQTENESALFPPSLRENTARPTSCLTHKHSYTCAIICECTPGHKGLATVQKQTSCYIRLETKASMRPHSHRHSRFRGTDIIEGTKKKKKTSLKKQNITQKTVNNTNAHASTLLCCGLFLGSVFIYFH